MSNKVFLDLDGTLARFNVRNSLQRFANEVGFFAKLKAYVGIEVINEMSKSGNLYIISASPNERTDREKMQWVEKYLPNFPRENITMCRIGENKAEIVQKKYCFTIDKSCYLLDDYTKNLIEWEQVGGKGIKRLTTCSDNSRKIWKGLVCKDLRKLASCF